jgi:guanylate kinase
VIMMSEGGTHGSDAILCAVPKVLLVISGPSGAGKGTLRDGLLDLLPGMRFSVSVTTRRPRPGEVNGRDYDFIGVDQFKDLIDRGELLEWASVHGNFYGTRRAHVDDLLGRGFDVLLELDAHGATRVKEKRPDAILIYVVPPSFEELKRRLCNRGTECESEVKRRLSDTSEQLAYLRCYDYVVVNDEIAVALNEIVSIVVAEKRKISRQDPKVLRVFEQVAGTECS